MPISARSLPLFLTLLAGLFTLPVQAQKTTVRPPDQVYQELFTDVQRARIFRDSKTFTDALPKRNPDSILAEYRRIRKNPAIRFSLKLFVEANFDIPAPAINTETEFKAFPPLEQHLEQLWEQLERKADVPVSGSSLLPLPHPYIVPGGRFREIYYWDSYFTQLGLAESGRWRTIEHMTDNFAYLINQYGHIPNGNRSYYLSRSQPPFFAMMVQLLARKNGVKTYVLYKQALLKEYAYWNDERSGTRHRVTMPDGSILHRYYDRDLIPRQESWYEDTELAKGKTAAQSADLYRQLRSGAESGWDFSTRWFADGKNLSTIETTNLVAADLNALLYQLELSLAKAHEFSGDMVSRSYYLNLAEKRKKAMLKYCWNASAGYWFDWKIKEKKQSLHYTLAGCAPLFLGLGNQAQATSVARVLTQKFLKPGGLQTTTVESGQQWDAPNGWAPLQYMAIKGLADNGQKPLADTIARRWIRLNKRVYAQTGKMMEKYNVADMSKEAGGGEYPGQDGFGWTNGVLLALMKEYGH